MAAYGRASEAVELQVMADLSRMPLPKPVGQRQKLRATSKGPVSQPTPACHHRPLLGNENTPTNGETL